MTTPSLPFAQEEQSGWMAPPAVLFSCSVVFCFFSQATRRGLEADGSAASLDSVNLETTGQVASGDARQPGLGGCTVAQRAEPSNVPSFVPGGGRHHCPDSASGAGAGGELARRSVSSENLCYALRLCVQTVEVHASPSAGLALFLGTIMSQGTAARLSHQKMRAAEQGDQHLLAELLTYVLLALPAVVWTKSEEEEPQTSLQGSSSCRHGETTDSGLPRGPRAPAPALNPAPHRSSPTPAELSYGGSKGARISKGFQCRGSPQSHGWLPHCSVPTARVDRATWGTYRHTGRTAEAHCLHASASQRREETGSLFYLNPPSCLLGTYVAFVCDLLYHGRALDEL